MITKTILLYYIGKVFSYARSSKNFHLTLAHNHLEFHRCKNQIEIDKASQIQGSTFTTNSLILKFDEGNYENVCSTGIPNNKKKKKKENKRKGRK